MHSVKRIYDGEKVQLLEKLEYQKPCKVIITFVEDDMDTENLREYPANEDGCDFWKAEEEDLYQDYPKQK